MSSPPSWYEYDDESLDPIYVYDPALDGGETEDSLETDDTLDIEDDDNSSSRSFSPFVQMEVLSPNLGSSPEEQDADLSDSSPEQDNSPERDIAAPEVLYVHRQEVENANAPDYTREEVVHTHFSQENVAVAAEVSVEPMAGCSNSPPREGAANKSMTDEDGQICTICFEPWTNTSDHRLVSLRCGHLFGRSCISRWLRGQNARCPQCNARARKSEIRNIYAKSVKVLDTTERDKAMADLQKECEKRRKAEMEAAQERLKYNIKMQECEHLRKELSSVQRLLVEYRAGNSSSRTQTSKPVSLFSLEKMVPLCKTGNCLKIGVSSLLNLAVATMPSANKLFSGEGFTKLSTVDFKLHEFVLVHQKCIKDLDFHPLEAMVVTASFDKTCKITNTSTNSVVQTYHLKDNVWSCRWDLDDFTYFYAGTQTGEVYLFDIRVTDRHVKVLPHFGKKAPVATISYLQSAQDKRICGPVVGQLLDSAFYVKDKGEYNIVPVQNLGPITSVSTEPTSGHFLLSCRPSAGTGNTPPNVTHTVCEIFNDRSVGGDSPSYRCGHLQTLLGGRSQVKLTKSKLMPHPYNPSSLLVAAGDEESGGALLWDASTGAKIDHFRTESPVVDFANYNINQQSLLLALTTENLRVYKCNL